jgi:hypothetical protein
MSQFCINCGKEVRSDLKVCPSCEFSIDQLPHDINGAEVDKKEKRLAIFSIVFGVLGIYPILGIGGIIGMIIAKKGLKSKHTRYGNQLKIGFWISLFGLVFWTVALIVTLIIVLIPIFQFIWENIIYYLRLLFGYY